MKFVLLFLHLLLLWTCTFADVQEVSYFSLLLAYLFIILTQSVEVMYFFLFLHSLLLWTYAFADVQDVSYFSLIHAYLFIILTQSVGSDVLFSLSPLATSVNLCICWCSEGKLDFIPLIILTKNGVSNMNFVFLFLHLLLLWTCCCICLCSACKLLFFITFIIVTKKCGEWHEFCLSLSPLATSVNLCIR